MINIELQNKINKLPTEVTELITLLITEEDEFDNVFIDNEDINTSILNKNRDEFFSRVLKLTLEVDTLKSFEDYLLNIGFSENEKNILVRNTKNNFIALVKDITNEIKLEEIAENEAKLSGKNEGTEAINSNQISHIDLLSEIENPTPSISTTTAFQKQAKQTTTNADTSTPSTKSTTPSKPPSSTYTLSRPANPSFHSPEIIAPYANPALNIAAKLDQKLSTPTASIPKDMYVSKKIDPYHEPVDL